MTLTLSASARALLASWIDQLPKDVAEQGQCWSLGSPVPRQLGYRGVKKRAWCHLAVCTCAIFFCTWNPYIFACKVNKMASSSFESAPVSLSEVEQQLTMGVSLVYIVTYRL